MHLKIAQVIQICTDLADGSTNAGSRRGFADARRQFNRAAELRSVKEEMYEHWARMDMSQREWTKAATAAEKGFEVDASLCGVKLLGPERARSQTGRELLGGLHHDRATKENELARAHLDHAYAAFEKGDRVSREDICRALVQLCETVKDPRGILRFLRLWKREVPDDYRLDTETQRLQHKFKATFDLDESDLPANIRTN